jgi:hypothetical protein
VGIILNNCEIAPGTDWRVDIRKGDGSAFLSGLYIGSMKLLGDLGGGGKNGMESVDSGGFPVNRSSTEERQGSFLINTKLDSLEIRTTNMEFREFSQTDGFAELMVPPSSGATGKWESREPIRASEAPRSGPGPAETLDLLPREADNATWAREGIDKGPIKDHYLLPDSGEGRSESGMSCEQTTEAVDTKIRNSSFGVDPMLFRKENPHKFLGTTAPTVAPEGNKGRVPEGPNFGSRKRGNLGPIKGLRNSSGSDHFLLGAERDGGSANDTGTTSPKRKTFSVSASDMGPGEVGVGTEDTMGIVDWDESLEEPSRGDFFSLMG